jgi:DNA-binding NtrC family response regulator
MARILIVDDDHQVRDFLQAALRKLGHEVVEVEDGKHASKAHAKTPFDLVITDLLMPGRDGLQTIFELAQMSPELRIIAISGGGTDSNLSADAMLKIARLLGASTTLEKPFGFKRLHELVDQVLASQ